MNLGVTDITITGGEPLLQSGLEDCLASVPPGRAIVQVFANAAALSADRTASLKKSGAMGIQVSLDSPEPEGHDRNRGKEGLFELVASGVRNALREGLLVGLSTYASNDSVAARQPPRITALAADWGVHEVSVFDLIPTGTLLGRKEAKLTAANRKALLRTVRTCPTRSTS